MSGYALERAKWIDPGCVPVEEVLGQNARTDSDAVLLVDVGGGLGQDIVDFQKSYGHLPGRLVLQDLPTVIESVQGLPTKVEAMGHDFFTPQPIHGTRQISLII